MAISVDWMGAAAEEIQGVSLLTAVGVRQIIEKHCPFKANTMYEEVDLNIRQQIIEKLDKVQSQVEGLQDISALWHGATLQCIDCKHTCSPASVLERGFFNPGRCICGSYFKVVMP